MGTVLRLNMIVQLILVGFTFDNVLLSGYLYGAGSEKNLQKLLRFCMSFRCILPPGLTAAIMMNAERLMHVFIRDAKMIENGAEMLGWDRFSGICSSRHADDGALSGSRESDSCIDSFEQQAGAVYLIAILIVAHLF
ncbi:MAG: hypothetical protein ACI4WR_05690 [Bulleidia sp.]